ncbi:MAG TPA: beta-propeller domain-containing protein [Candidatus Acidoferrales bacterium]|nr:beta-propeller domain-containing protein [Candidatus Acidoferrales bacterium]
MVQKEVKKKTSVYGATAVLLAIVLVSMVYVVGTVPLIFPSQSPSVTGMKTFSSNQELIEYLNSNTNGYSSYSGGPLDSEFFGSRNFGPVPAHITSGATDNFGQEGGVGFTSTNEYSTTNIQVAGVDEADTVKTDGSYIYTISNEAQSYWYAMNSYGATESTNAIFIVDAESSNARVVSKINVDGNVEPAGLFLSSDSNRLVIIASKYQYYLYGSARGDEIAPMIMPSYNADVYSFIYVYDVSNKANPVLARNLTVSGSYFNSRMIGDDVYVVVSQTAWVNNDVVSLPVAYEDNVAYDASPQSIYYADMNDTSYTFTSFYGLDINNDVLDATNMTVLMGGASAMYVSTDNLYVTYTGWDQTSGQYTSIYRVAIDGLQLSLAAQGGVPGYTLNQYSMDEYNGYFRIATNWYGDTQINNVYVLNSDLASVGKLEGLAPNENLHATRFIGNRCYLVTFQTTDPLFVVDLSDPANPALLGELKIPGYSDYLHPYDENHLIGLGKDAVVNDETAYYQGVKLALFDVSNVNNPVQVQTVTIGDRGSDSEALYNPKAFLFDKTQNLLVIPVSYAVVSESALADAYSKASAYGTTVWQGAYVYTVTESGFTLKGTVTHLNATLLGSDGYLKDPSGYYNSQNQWITRSLYIGNVLYTVSNSEVKLNNLSDLSEIGTVYLS